MGRPPTGKKKKKRKKKKKKKKKVDAEVDGHRVIEARTVRTARILMDGKVFVPPKLS